mgnify:CR=1 FL=1
MLLRPNFDAASNIRDEGVEMQRLAAAGITTVLAVPPAGTIRGTSALVNVVAPSDDPSTRTCANAIAPLAASVTFPSIDPTAGRTIVSSLRTIAACPSPAQVWNAYAGGFLLRARRECVPLTFTVGRRSQTVRFGLGGSCGRA